ncbi:carbohydrate ABC transporter permease [Saccharothrix variisporea]|uniref:Carbohydrate ABC transporter membrane protein 1 (CUT1 family) n=1 Tax=Saccharothrix variisporea TaxID=543527 RepID=A0A495X3U8_9PSEU|nr:sugar ABC transporter permease [Saccharothrix variisporea]RKT67844.1 carbohydrate ABC transporter membrane protein 1 (CUT1 family) [Saccharothrix variisporea]
MTPRLAGWLFVLPALAVYGVFVLRPLALVAQYSLYRWDGVGPSTWVGWDNYAAVLTDPDLRRPLVNALLLVVAFAGGPVVLGLALAVVVRPGPVLVLPQAVPPVAAGLAWSVLLSSTGAVNRALDAVGLGGVTRAWLGDSATALAAVGVIGAWALVGLCALLLSAGVRRLDPALYEAARLDGAGRWREFRAVTLPGVRREIGVCVVVTSLAALSSFDVVYVTTRGGPGGATAVPALEVFHLAFTQREVGLASALAVLLVVLVLGVVAPVLRWSR